MNSLSLLGKLIALRIAPRTVAQKMLPVSYTVSVSYKCNSRCKTCNIWKKKSSHLTVEQYDKIFKSIGRKVYWVTMSGGEPFLRKDLTEIVTTIYRRSRPKIINIPTNGLLYDRIIHEVKRIALNCPFSTIVINLSVDDIGEKDNFIRGVPKAWDNAMKTYAGLKELHLPNLNIGIHTVISRFNVGHFQKIADHLMGLNPDSYITEIAENRVELGTMKSNITPSAMEYSAAIDYLLHQIKNTKFSGMNKITQTFRIEYYSLVKRILKYHTQQLRCYAGTISAQIAPDGNVWPCCIRALSVGNLHNYNYDFKALWKSSELLKQERDRIHKEKCFCPMANASYTNMLMNNRIAAKAFFRLFKK